MAAENWSSADRRLEIWAMAVEAEAHAMHAAVMAARLIELEFREITFIYIPILLEASDWQPSMVPASGPWLDTLRGGRTLN